VRPAERLATDFFIQLINRPRYLLYLWPMAALLTALGIEQLPQRGVNPAVICLSGQPPGYGITSIPALKNLDHNLRLPWRTSVPSYSNMLNPATLCCFIAHLIGLFESLEFKHYTMGCLYGVRSLKRYPRN